MRDILEIQKKAFIENGQPTYNQRLDSLNRCIALLETHDEQIIEALNEDYKNRSHHEIMTSEVIQSIRNLNFTIKNFKKWMKPMKRTPSFMAGMLGSKAYLEPSPLGTVGIIAPWNFPVGMIFYPAASVLAAGNRIMAKPSEFTPQTAQLIKDAVAKYFDQSEFKVVESAAQNLVPTTLELGGKSPTIIGKDADLSLAAKRIMFVKTLNAGQICLSPDYVFLPRGMEEKFLSELQKAFNQYYPDGNEADYTSMVNETHFERMQSYMTDAQEKGAKIHSLGTFDSTEKNTITTKVLMGVNDSMQVMKDEIFGPLLPIMVYDEISEVINYINKNDHPLGLYYFGNTKQEQEKVIKNTRSGGVTINDAMFHLMQSQLPFGGVGPSGYGCYHGREGFMNFSNMRSIYYQTNNDSVFGMLRPPKNKSIGKLQNILKKLS
jgi:coniferyl-aldehyde dehydrogenase